MAGSLGALGGLVLFVTICKALLSAGFEVTERWRKTTREEGRVNRRGMPIPQRGANACKVSWLSSRREQNGEAE